MSVKQKFPVGVSVLLTNAQGQFLMALRKNCSANGMISTPGGRLEQEENLLDCARREFLEETGALLGSVKIITWCEHFRFGNHYFMFYAHASSYSGIIQNRIPDKSEDWRWYSPAELTKENCTEPKNILDYILRKKARA